jgi:hypothetical protein
MNRTNHLFRGSRDSNPDCDAMRKDSPPQFGQPNNSLFARQFPINPPLNDKNFQPSPIFFLRSFNFNFYHRPPTNQLLPLFHFFIQTFF